MLKKTKVSRHGARISEQKIGNFSLYKEIKTPFYRRLYLCSLPVLFYRNRVLPTSCKNCFKRVEEWALALNTYTQCSKKSLLLWVDHSLGGGTENYSFAQFKQLQSKYTVVRLQYFTEYDCFIISTPNNEVGAACFLTLQALPSFPQLAEIVVNNLVGYKDTLAVLKLVVSLKQQQPSLKVSYRGHDYQAICPSFNLLNCEGEFCNLSHPKGCAYCSQAITFDPVLRSGFTDISSWRSSWQDFFTNTVDEMIVFSDSVKSLFCRMYPVLETKICVVPHKSRNYPVVKIPPHKGINIGILGNISSVPKGYKLLAELCQHLTQSDVRLIVIGNYKNPPARLKVLGKYKPNDLPAIIQSQKIDLIFIPSIVPETFSYTTAEAISMGLPVACYRLGAPGERVAAYKKGLILEKIDPATNLTTMVEFIKHLQHKEA